MSEKGASDALTDAVDPVAGLRALDVRVGRIVRAEPNAAARVPALKLWLDLGPLGERTSSAQIASLYRPEDLVGRLVLAAVNLGPKRIAGFASEVLVLGVPDAEGRVVLLQPDRDVPLGGRMY
jgi:tRNA-binding protein